MKEAQAKASPQVRSPQLQTAFVTAFIKAAQDALAVQCGLKVAGGNPVTKEQADSFDAVVAVVGGIVGADVDCSFVFLLSQGSAKTLIGAMAGGHAEKPRPQMLEAAAELTRIVGFQAKRLLNERGFAVQAVIPRLVVEGNGLNFSGGNLREPIVLPFRTPTDDEFRIEII